MTIEESDPIHISDHILDWLEDSESFLNPIFFDDPYSSDDIRNQEWWNQPEEIHQDSINNTDTTSVVVADDQDHIISDRSQVSNPTRKREAPDDDPITKKSQQRKKQNIKISNESQENDQVAEVVTCKKSNGNKRNSNKTAGNNGNNKEGRWAEHLLNPCAFAVTTGNLSRVQHLLYVLHELASSTGDANHRLAFYGLRALTRHLSSSSTTSAALDSPKSFTSTEPKLFQRSLLKFYEVSPWFALPNNIANSSILQILSQEHDDLKKNLHILDIGVSHGVQWPTLLEALTRRSGGPPPLVRITVITAAVDQNSEIPFSVGPPGDNFSSRLLTFAKSLNINLQINRVDSHLLQNLDAQVINTNPEETLIVCAQFRLHHLNHSSPDERTEFLKILKDLKPKGVILSENNTDCSCNSCGDFATGFSRRVDYLWKFLDSISAAFKGGDSEERRMMEGEAAKALTNCGEMNEGKEKWCERMRGVGFVAEVFGEDAIDGARALLRKYDSSWEMRMDETDGCVGLWWKGQPVSFCSLWKLNNTGNDS
ncbi:protein NODULATION SIGNALING PATHWAY 1 [Mercurialis annua]|uniref:protein NODULATION SIGNALING PATHWAY 1 n=1 Tax=Mercurialis annua TaxID=3986 RepID=UPI00215E2C6E|nr:protein NODULATION SIGNALING PATHWAY 1 [Mercurialis annua]